MQFQQCQTVKHILVLCVRVWELVCVRARGFVQIFAQIIKGWPSNCWMTAAWSVLIAVGSQEGQQEKTDEAGVVA